MMNQEIELVEKDAVSAVSPYNKIQFFSSGRIVSENLPDILNDLDVRNRVAIIFLLVDQTTDFTQLLEDLKHDISEAFLKLNCVRRWKEKLLEALIITNNIKVLRKLGYDKDAIQEMKRRFVPTTHNVSQNLNRVIKSLHHLCESLRKNEVETFISEIGTQIDPFFTANQNLLCLEFYILYLLQKGQISIEPNRPQLDQLIRAWKKLGHSHDPNFNFDDWNHENKYYSQDSSQVSAYESIQSNNIDDNVVEVNPNAPWPPQHKRLFIIINEMIYKNEIRKGSEIDEARLEETFTGCDFVIEKRRNITADEMMVFLDSLNGEPYTTYGSIFLCILSHGKKGEIILSDGSIQSIEKLEEKFCCKNLENTFKLLILQSCQGKDLGVKDVDSIVETDGPNDSLKDPLIKRHYARFQATIKDYAAARDPKKGSWFIEAICNAIQEHEKEVSVLNLGPMVTKRVTLKRGRTNHDSKKIVQLPFFSHTILDDYIIPKYKGRRQENHNS